jgi:hypothetical protein
LGIKRQIKRNKTLEKRQRSRRKIKNVEKSLSQISNVCTECTSKFNPKDQNQLDTWMVRVVEGKISMYCAECYSEN